MVGTLGKAWGGDAAAGGGLDQSEKGLRPALGVAGAEEAGGLALADPFGEAPRQFPAEEAEPGKDGLPFQIGREGIALQEGEMGLNDGTDRLPMRGAQKQMSLHQGTDPAQAPLDQLEIELGLGLGDEEEDSLGPFGGADDFPEGEGGVIAGGEEGGGGAEEGFALAVFFPFPGDAVQDGGAGGEEHGGGSLAI